MFQKKRLVQITGKLDEKLGGPFTAFTGTLPFLTKIFSTDLVVFGSYSLDLTTYHSVIQYPTFFNNRYGLTIGRTSREIVQVIESTDLMLIHGFYLASTIKALKLATPKTPIFIMPHGSLEDFQEKRNRLMKFFFKKLFNKIGSKKNVVFITATTKEAKNVSRIFPKHRVEIVGIGTNENQSTKRNLHRNNAFVMVGRIHKVKRIDIAIESFSRIAYDFPEYKLLIIGSGSKSLTKFLKKLVQNYGLNDRIIFIPHLANNEAKIEIAKAKILINCSDNENFSISCAEATSEGTPVITSSKTGFSELINLYGSGVVITSNEVDLLEKGLREILLNWQHFHENCIENSKYLSWKYVSKRWLAVMAEEK